MKLQYTYEVIAVDSDNNFMEVQYTSSGRDDVLVGMPLPETFQDLESHIRLHSPEADWLEKIKPRQVVPVGHTGSVDTSVKREVSNSEIIFQGIIDILPEISKGAVKKLLTKDFKNIRLRELYNSKSNLVGLELLGVTAEVSASEGARMYASATSLIETALELGVSIVSISDVKNVQSFLGDIHNFSEHEFTGDFKIYLSPEVEGFPETIARASAHEEKLFAVSQIKVTTASGKTFDGDEIAQSRMARAVTFSNPGETTLWMMADNTVQTVTHEELKEAGRLAGEAQTSLWMG